MDVIKIRTLLEKYYSGDTSIDEENTLRNYFEGEDIDSEFITDKDIFLYNIHEKKAEEYIPDLTDEIWNNIQKNDSGETSNQNRLVYFYLRIAAGIIILFGVYFLIQNQIFNKGYKIKYSDTYNNPEQAYKQARETLLYVSVMLNKGTDHMEPIHKVNKEAQKLNKLSFFNDGLKELRPIKTYNVTNKYFKQ